MNETKSPTLGTLGRTELPSCFFLYIVGVVTQTLLEMLENSWYLK